MLLVIIAMRAKAYRLQAFYYGKWVDILIVILIRAPFGLMLLTRPYTYSFTINIHLNGGNRWAGFNVALNAI